MKNFQMPLIGLALLLLLTNKISAQDKEYLSHKDKLEIVTTVIHLLHENYIFPERVDTIEQYILQKLNNGGYDSISKPDIFIASLNDDLRKQGHDTHLNISYGPERVQQIKLNTSNEGAGKEDEITGPFLQRIQYENFRLRKLEWLTGNVGYFSFLNFVPLGPAKQSITAALNFLHYSDAIILDLRDNGGGNAETMIYMLSYFLQDSVQIAEWRYRKDNKLVKIYTTKDEMIQKIPEATPLYILVNHNTSSAAEGFSYALQQYGRAVIIGEQTQGEGNPGKIFAINDDLYVMIPTIEATHPVSKKSIDGIGVIPDIVIDPDLSLAKALQDAYSTLLLKTNDNSRKILYEWQLPRLENDLNPAVLSEKIISSLIGDYEGGRKVIFEDGKVCYINTKGEKVKLEYLGKGVFQNSQRTDLRLVMPFTEEPVPYFDWTWDDGGPNQRVQRIIK